MCDYTQTAWSTGIIIGRYILVLPLHYKYDGLHSCRSKECVGPGVEASCRVQDVSSSGLTAVDHKHPQTRHPRDAPFKFVGVCSVNVNAAGFLWKSARTTSAKRDPARTDGASPS